MLLIVLNLYERERLIAREKDLHDETALVTSVTLQQQIQNYLKQVSHLWHQPETGVYIPRAWQNNVLAAIKANDNNTLHTYWEKHPGLVTTLYPLDDRRVRLHTVFITHGCLKDFSQWLEYYSMHTKYDTVPSIATLFGHIEEGQHILHPLIESQREQQWHTLILQELGMTGDAYHGLVHLHSTETATADKAAIQALLAQEHRPTAQDENGYTPLMLALSQGKYAIAEILLPHSTLNSQDALGNTPLHHAVSQAASKMRDSFIVNLLGHGMNDTLTNEEDKTAEALLDAKESGHYRVLLRALKNKQRGRVHALEEKVTTLEQALKLQQAQIEATVNKQLQTLTEEVKALQSENAQLKALSVQRTTQLKNVLSDEKVQQKFYAPKKQYLRHLFLAGISEIETVDKGMKAVAADKFQDKQDKLVDACTQGNLNLVKQLYAQGASLDEPNRAGEYPLVAACRVMSVDIIDYIDAQSKAIHHHWKKVKETCAYQMRNTKTILNKIREDDLTKNHTYRDLEQLITSINEADEIINLRNGTNTVRDRIEEAIKKWDVAWAMIKSFKACDYNWMCLIHGETPIYAQRFSKENTVTSIVYSSFNEPVSHGRIERHRKAMVHLLEIVNQCRDTLKNIQKRVEYYESRMEECAIFLDPGKNKPAINA